ncbi:hypothetical protein O9992_19410 [Vibrio lentus]|nr:hypothetical protein [Vibrio lentus]
MPWCDTYLNTHHDGKRSDGVSRGVNVTFLLGGPQNLGAVPALESRHQLDKRVQQDQNNGYENRYRMKGYKCKGRRPNGQLKKVTQRSELGEW